MAEIDESVVARRAKALAEQDGFMWELNFTAAPPLTPIQFQGRYLDDERREQYVSRAREELRKKADNA